MADVQIERMLEVAQQMLIKDGDLVPTAFLVTDEDEVAIVGISDMPSEAHERHQVMFDVGRSISGNEELTGEIARVILIHDAWMTTVTEEEYKTLNRRPSESPNRQEVLIAVGSSGIGQTDDLLFRPYERTPAGIVFYPDIKRKTTRMESHMVDALWRGLHVAFYAHKPDGEWLVLDTPQKMANWIGLTSFREVAECDLYLPRVDGPFRVDIPEGKDPDEALGLERSLEVMADVIRRMTDD